MPRVFTDERCLVHQAPFGYPECRERLDGVLDGLREAGAEIVASCSHAGARRSILALHDEAYVERFRRAAERGDGLLDSADNPISKRSWEAAGAAVEVVLSAADAALDSAGRPHFAAVRPPGHHAERAEAMGFCFFNNIAVAAEYLRRDRGLERVAIYDFDVHHGNGTQHLFEERGDVFFASSHQFPFYPGTGAAGERGLGDGEGATLNVPLDVGTGDADFLAILDGEILPALHAFRPDMLLVSAGFDAWAIDPLGGLRWSHDCFYRIGERLRALSEEICGGRLLSVLEGGYDLKNLPGLVDAYLQGVEGRAYDDRLRVDVWGAEGAEEGVEDAERN